MDDPQNPDFITYDLEYDAVISNSEPPIAFERGSQRFSITFRSAGQPGVYGARDPISKVLADCGDVLVTDIRMINESVGHGSV